MACESIIHAPGGNGSGLGMRPSKNFRAARSPGVARRYRKNEKPRRWPGFSRQA
jgi:hypothetical protein